ncbi:uncharacterized protein LOC122091834 [Macadamia integrifolia]|uniref:uncharacterized protein LOC122091834 n=1 Tax=Macadamia integrifolia TaxID=60698 RepID=UPI001C4EE004|nr:uncharacterized protein LOC122091834 [Macadamia integrifolia]
MAICSSRWLALAVIIFMAGSLISSKGVSSQGCGLDLMGLVYKCLPIIQNLVVEEVTQSHWCCGALKNVEIPCVCKYITKELEELFSMDKVVDVAEQCGVTLPHGMICGSYTIPKA